jgi:hypothetical protein
MKPMPKNHQQLIKERDKITQVISERYRSGARPEALGKGLNIAPEQVERIKRMLLENFPEMEFERIDNLNMRAGKISPEEVERRQKIRRKRQTALRIRRFQNEKKSRKEAESGNFERNPELYDEDIEAELWAREMEDAGISPKDEPTY